MALFLVRAVSEFAGVTALAIAFLTVGFPWLRPFWQIQPKVCTANKG